MQVKSFENVTELKYWLQITLPGMLVSVIRNDSTNLVQVSQRPHNAAQNIHNKVKKSRKIGQDRKRYLVQVSKMALFWLRRKNSTGKETTNQSWLLSRFTFRPKASIGNSAYKKIENLVLSKKIITVWKRR